MRAPPDTVNVLGTITKMNFLSGLMGHAKQRARERDQALSLYVASVEQARRPGFYTDCGVADTLDGRFDLIVLHVSGHCGRPASRANVCPISSSRS